MEDGYCVLQEVFEASHTSKLKEGMRVRKRVKYKPQGTSDVNHIWRAALARTSKESHGTNAKTPKSIKMILQTPFWIHQESPTQPSFPWYFSHHFQDAIISCTCKATTRASHFLHVGINRSLRSRSPSQLLISFSPSFPSSLSSVAFAPPSLRVFRLRVFASSLPNRRSLLACRLP